MYRVLIICLFSALVAAKNQEIFKLPPEKINIIEKHVAPCAKKYNVDSDIFKRVIDGTLPQDQPTKEFLYCFGLGIRIITEDGHIIVDRMSNLLGNHPLLEEFKTLLNNCNKITKENHLETLIAMNSCINNNSPVIFSV